MDTRCGRTSSLFHSDNNSADHALLFVTADIAEERVLSGLGRSEFDIDGLAVADVRVDIHSGLGRVNREVVRRERSLIRDFEPHWYINNDIDATGLKIVALQIHSDLLHVVRPDLGRRFADGDFRARRSAADNAGGYNRDQKHWKWNLREFDW